MPARQVSLVHVTQQHRGADLHLAAVHHLHGLALLLAGRYPLAVEQRAVPRAQVRHPILTGLAVERDPEVVLADVDVGQDDRVVAALPPYRAALEGDDVERADFHVGYRRGLDDDAHAGRPRARRLWKDGDGLDSQTVRFLSENAYGYKISGSYLTY